MEPQTTEKGTLWRVVEILPKTQGTRCDLFALSYYIDNNKRQEDVTIETIRDWLKEHFSDAIFDQKLNELSNENKSNEYKNFKKSLNKYRRYDMVLYPKDIRNGLIDLKKRIEKALSTTSGKEAIKRITSDGTGKNVLIILNVKENKELEWYPIDIDNFVPQEENCSLLRCCFPFQIFKNRRYKIHPY